MSVQRLAKYQTDDPFTRVPNTAVDDPNLDLKSRGLLLIMLSKPDGWVFRERHLADVAGVGREQLRTAMQKLIDAGYVVRTRESVDGLPPVCVTKVFDRAVEPGVRNPDLGNPDRRETGPISNEGVLVTNEGRKAQRLSSMRPDWKPGPENLQGLEAKHPSLNVGQELEAFRDYWISKGERRADWDAGFRTWCRNAERWAKPAKGDVPHSRPAKVGPDQCPDCGQRWADHDDQVHELLLGRI